MPASEVGFWVVGSGLWEGGTPGWFGQCPVTERVQRGSGFRETPTEARTQNPEPRTHNRHPGIENREPITLAARFCLLAALTLLAACATREPRPAGDWLAEREALFEKHPEWSVQGRLGLSDGDRGGSLAFDWQAQGEHHRVGLRTLAGGRQWQLEFGPGYAVLEGTDIDTLSGPDPDPLVEQAVGWPIPVAWMSRWLRGLPAPPEADLEFREDGTLAGLEHGDWSLEIRRFTTLDNGALAPARMQALNPPYRVRAALSGWRLVPDGGASPDEEPL